MLLSTRLTVTDDMTPKFSWPVIERYCEKIKINPEKAKTKTDRREITISAGRKLEDILLISPVIDQYHSIAILNDDTCNVEVDGKSYVTDGKTLKFLKSLYLNTTNPNAEFCEVMFNYAAILSMSICTGAPMESMRVMRPEYTELQKLLVKELTDFYLEEIL